MGDTRRRCGELAWRGRRDISANSRLARLLMATFMAPFREALLACSPGSLAGLAAATVPQSANVVLVPPVASDSASGSVPQRPQAFAQTSPTVSVPVSTVSQFWATGDWQHR